MTAAWIPQTSHAEHDEQGEQQLVNRPSVRRTRVVAATAPAQATVPTNVADNFAEPLRHVASPELLSRILHMREQIQQPGTDASRLHAKAKRLLLQALHLPAGSAHGSDTAR